MNRYKIYLATDVEVTAFSAEQARQKALCGFMTGIACATDDTPMRILDVTMMHIPEKPVPMKRKKKSFLGGFL